MKQCRCEQSWVHLRALSRTAPFAWCHARRRMVSGSHVVACGQGHQPPRARQHACLVRLPTATEGKGAHKYVHTRHSQRPDQLSCLAAMVAALTLSAAVCVTAPAQRRTCARRARAPTHHWAAVALTCCTVRPRRSSAATCPGRCIAWCKPSHRHCCSACAHVAHVLCHWRDCKGRMPENAAAKA